MRKKRILFCSEATFLNTGYATYTREILNYLHGTGKDEIAELGAYGQRNDPRANNIPWKYYGVAPNTDFEPKATQEELQVYNQSGTNQFGEWIFEHVCLDFMPDVVCDIRDFWMLEFAERSPFRKFFNLKKVFIIFSIFFDRTYITMCLSIIRINGECFVISLYRIL